MYSLQALSDKVFYSTCKPLGYMERVSVNFANFVDFFGFSPDALALKPVGSTFTPLLKVR